MGTNAKKATGRVITLDADRLGHVVGALAALVVLAVCLFYQEVDGWTAALRVAWVFVLGYFGTFVFVRWVLRTALAEYVERERLKKGPVAELEESFQVAKHVEEAVIAAKQRDQIARRARLGISEKKFKKSKSRR